MTVAELTIEQLAAASGMSVRNIRAHQARGLLDPPQVRLRVGYYGAGHLAQLTLIRDLQADGFNLAGIKRLLEDARGSGERLARVREALIAGDESETPVTFSRFELEQIERHCDAISETFVRLFLEQVWRPYEAAGMPEERRREIDESIAALRPLAGEALQTIFAQRMHAQLQDAFGALTRRLGEQ
jgi:DNA-binding transcriptional MerR regulator